MDIGLIIILIITFALVVGPITMLRPNPAQKNKERMRLVARTKGVLYSVRNIPRQADESDNPAPMPVYFVPPAKSHVDISWMLVRSNYHHDIHFLGWWVWQGEARAKPAEISVLEQYLPALLPTVSAISAGKEGICVYWNETGGDPVLQQILALLESLTAMSQSH